MKRFARILLSALLPAVAIAPASAAADLSAPKVTVRIERGDVDIDHSQNHRQIKSMMQCRRPATRGKYVGLSTATFRSHFSSTIAITPQGAGVTGGLVAADVVLNIEKRTVYVASELPQGGCSFEQTRSHELGHVRIDDEIATLFAPRIAAAVKAAAKNLTNLQGRTPEDITSAIQGTLNLVMEQQMRALQALRDSRQETLDSASEYSRLSKACHGETEALVRAADEDEQGWYEDVGCPGP